MATLGKFHLDCRNWIGTNPYGMSQNFFFFFFFFLPENSQKISALFICLAIALLFTLQFGTGLGVLEKSLGGIQLCFKVRQHRSMGD